MKDEKNSRINLLKKRIKGMSDPEDIMIEIISIFDRTELIPEVGKYYTFIYNAKTPEINYDQHPLIACIEISKWGFAGINFHLGSRRHYTWEEIAGQLHIIEDSEISYIRQLNYAKYINK